MADMRALFKHILFKIKLFKYESAMTKLERRPLCKMADMRALIKHMLFKIKLFKYDSAMTKLERRPFCKMADMRAIFKHIELNRHITIWLPERQPFCNMADTRIDSRGKGKFRKNNREVFCFI
jgi:hypothetical protein